MSNENLETFKKIVDDFLDDMSDDEFIAFAKTLSRPIGDAAAEHLPSCRSFRFVPGCGVMQSCDCGKEEDLSKSLDILRDAAKSLEDD